MASIDACRPPATPIQRFPTLVSTNDEAMRLARAGHGGALWIVAAEQPGGRGRRGRTWVSPPGNLYASLLLVDPAPLARLPELGFVAGVALAEALSGLLPAPLALRIKWPNDMLVDGAKLSGLMLEASQLPRRRTACIVGIGVNCASHPDALAYPAAALSGLLERAVSPASVMARLAPSLDHWLALYDRGAGFETIRSRWLKWAGGVGQAIAVATGSRHIEGVFTTIDAGGRLVVETPYGTETIAAGDVFLAAPTALPDLIQTPVFSES